MTACEQSGSVSVKTTQVFAWDWFLPLRCILEKKLSEYQSSFIALYFIESFEKNSWSYYMLSSF